MSPARPDPNAPAPRRLFAEVRYSLPELLDELKSERADGSFGMEKLDQKEIGKLFKAKAPRRVKSK